MTSVVISYTGTRYSAPASPLNYPESFADLWMGDNQEALDDFRDWYLKRTQQLGIIEEGAKLFTDKMPLNEVHLGMIHLWAAANVAVPSSDWLDVNDLPDLVQYWPDLAASYPDGGDPVGWYRDTLANLVDVLTSAPGDVAAFTFLPRWFPGMGSRELLGVGFWTNRARVAPR